MYNKTSFDRINEGFSERHGRQKARIQWVKAAKTYFEWVLMRRSSWSLPAARRVPRFEDHLGFWAAAISRERASADASGGSSAQEAYCSVRKFPISGG